MVKKLVSIDYAGITLASLCFIHCLGTLFIFTGYTTSSFIFLNFLDNPQMHAAFILLSVFLGILSSLVAYKLLHNSSKINRKIKSILGLGVFCLLAGLSIDLVTESGAAIFFLLTGAVAIILLHIQLLLVKRQITD